MDKVIAGIVAERKRQMEVEGWTLEHDDEHDDGSLARAAACYAMPAAIRIMAAGVNETVKSRVWPLSWAPDWWKPKDRRRDLIRAAALIVAEIERLDRIKPEIDNG